MKRDILTILILTGVVVAAVLFIGPYMMTPTRSTQTSTDSIPLKPIQVQPLQPLYPQSSSKNATSTDRRHVVRVKCRTIDASDGGTARAAFQFVWKDANGVSQQTKLIETTDYGVLDKFIKLPRVSMTLQVTSSSRSMFQYEPMEIPISSPGDRLDLGTLELSSVPTLMIRDAEGGILDASTIALYRIEQGKVVEQRTFQSQRIQIKTGHWVAGIPPVFDKQNQLSFAWFIEFDINPGRNTITLPSPDPASLQRPLISYRTRSGIKPGWSYTKLSLLGPYGLDVLITRSETDGSFDAGLLKPGSYRASVFSNYDTSRRSKEFDVLPDSQPEPIEIMLNEPGAVKVNVTRSGRPVPGLNVELSWSHEHSIPEVEGVPTNEHGDAYFGGLGRGHYYLYWKGFDWLYAPSVDVEVGRVSELNVDLDAHTGAMLRMQIKSNLGNSRSLPCELLMSQAGDFAAYLRVPLVDGAFTLRNVPPGEYVFEALFNHGQGVDSVNQIRSWRYRVVDERDCNVVQQVLFRVLRAKLPELSQQPDHVWLLHFGEDSVWQSRSVQGRDVHLKALVPGEYFLAFRAEGRLWMARADLTSAGCVAVFWRQHISEASWPTDLPALPE